MDVPANEAAPMLRGPARRPVLGLVILWLLGSAAGLRAGAPMAWLLPTALAAALGALFARGGRSGALLLGFSVALTGWLHVAMAVREPSPRAWSRQMARDREQVELIGLVTDDPVEADAWRAGEVIRRFTLRLEGVRYGGEWRRARGSVAVFWRTGQRPDGPRYGDRWLGRGLLERTARFRDGTGGWVLRFRPEAAGGRILSSGQGSAFVAWCLDRRRACAQVLARGLEAFPEEAALLRALMLGYRQDLSPDLSRALSTTGTMHIIAISGLHVGIMVALLIALLKALNLSRTCWVLYLAPALAVYAVATGLSASTMRASLMAVLVLGGPLAGRRPDGPTILALAALVILAAAPLQLTELGFILSFAAVAGLLTWCPAWFRRLRPWLERDPWAAEPETRWRRMARSAARYLAALALATAAVWLATAPLTARYFNLVAPLSLAGNLVVVPLSFVVLMTGVLSLLFGAVSGWMAEVFNHANRVFLGGMLWAIRGLASLRWSYAYVVAPAGAAVALWYAWLLGVRVARGPARRAILAAGAVGLAAAWALERYDPETRVDVLDVGQGQAVHLRLPGARHLLIDPGPVHAGREVLRHLRRQGVNRLEALVLTHGDIEHIGAAPLLFDQVPVRELWCAPDLERSRPHRPILDEARRRGLALRTWASGDVLAWPRGVEWEVLHPERGTSATRADEASLVVRVAYGPGSVLLMGGGDGTVEAALLARPLDLGAAVLLAGDHGAAGVCSEAWLDAVRPRAVAISVGADNLRGQPDAETLSRLAARNIPVWRTDRDGGVRLVLDGRSTATPWRPIPR